MAESANLTRRSALSTLSVAAFATSIPVVAASEQLSPIMTLFHQWHATREEACEHARTHPQDDDGYMRLNARVDDLMVEIAALTPTTAQDFAAKLASLTHYGSYDELYGDKWGLGSAIIREAATLVGHPERVVEHHLKV